jgi:hypothetical protein
VECNDDQLALCAYIDGQIVARCYSRPTYVLDIPDSAGQQLALRNWAISVISGTDRAASENISEEWMKVLTSGEYKDPSGDLVRFSLPDDLGLFSSQRSKSLY